MPSKSLTTTAASAGQAKSCPAGMEAEAGCVPNRLMACGSPQRPCSSNSSLDGYDAAAVSDGSTMEPDTHARHRRTPNDSMQAAVRTLLAGVGEDPDRQGLRDTPKVRTVSQSRTCLRLAPPAVWRTADIDGEVVALRCWSGALPACRQAEAPLCLSVPMRARCHVRFIGILYANGSMRHWAIRGDARCTLWVVHPSGVGFRCCVATYVNACLQRVAKAWLDITTGYDQDVGRCARQATAVAD